MSVGGAEEHSSALPGYSRDNPIPSHALQIISSNSSLHKGCITSLTVIGAGGGADSSAWHNPSKDLFLAKESQTCYKWCPDSSKSDMTNSTTYPATP